MTTLAPAITPARSRGPRPAPRADGLTPLQRRMLVGLVVGLHLAASCALMQVRQVREAVAEAAPMFVRLVAPPAPPAPPPVVRPAPRAAPVAKPLVTAAPVRAPDPTAITAPPEPPPEPAAEEAPAPPPMIATAPPPVPVRTIPASAVQYLEPPAPVYPRASRRAGESGRVLLRVLVDEAGVPRQVLLQASSGFTRLDDAATAAVLKARFKPYSDDGRPVAGWALVPLSFDLEQ